VAQKRPELTSRQIKRLEELLRTVSRARELKRIQCVLLAGTTDWPLGEIGQLVGVDPQETRNIIYRYLQLGEAALVADDQGKARRQARLTLFQEEQLLRVLLEDAAAGIPSTATQAHDRLQSLYGEYLPKSMVYDIFRRHGWKPLTTKRSFDEGGPLETPYQPAGRSVKQTSRKPDRAVRSLEKSRGHEGYHLVAAEDEVAVIRELEKRVGKGVPVTRREAQELLSEAAGREVSLQTTARTLRRYGWRVLKYGSYSIWVPDECSEEQVLMERHLEARPESLLSDEESRRRVLKAVEQLWQRGEQITTGKVRKLVALPSDALPSHEAVRKFLLRNGWLMQGEGRNSHWVAAGEN